MGDTPESVDVEKKEREPISLAGKMRYWLLTTTAFSTALFAITFLPQLPDILRPNLYVGTITLPVELVARGMSTKTLALGFIDRITEINRKAQILHLDKAPYPADKSSSGLPSLSSEKINLLTQIKLPVGDIDTAPIIARIRSALGIEDTEISATLQLIPSSEGKPFLELHGRTSGRELWSETAQGNDIGTLLDVLALRFVERFDPLTAGFYYLARSTSGENNLDRAMSLIEGIPPGGKQEVWSHLFRGIVWREKGGHETQTYLSFCSAIEKDPRFTPAWRNLGGALRANARWSKAEDAALRLTEAFPSEPEGYRQIGYVYGRDCRLGNAKERVAQANYLHAIELDRQRNPGKDYLGLIDYARFLNEWASEERRLPADPAYGIAENTPFLDAAERYLTIAQTHAPREASIYTTFARVLGRPRPAQDENDPQLRDARLYQAEIKGRFALSIDRDQPMANFVMAELLTDGAVTNHVYGAKEKFVQAETYLDTIGEWTALDPQYAAFRARSLAGQGHYAEAEAILTPFEGRPHAPRVLGLVEWVHSELLYNRARQTSDRAVAAPLLEEATRHISTARTLLPCGPRAATVADLSDRIRWALAPAEEERFTPVPPRALTDRSDVPVCTGWQKIDRETRLAAITAPVRPLPMIGWTGLP